MAELTENLLLEKPAEDDYYDVGVHNRNMDKIDRNVVKSASLSEIRVVSQDTYNSITPEEDVLYLTDAGTMYLGSTPMKSGGGTLAAASSLEPDYTGAEGTASVLEMESE